MTHSHLHDEQAASPDADAQQVEILSYETRERGIIVGSADVYEYISKHPVATPNDNVRLIWSIWASQENDSSTTDSCVPVTFEAFRSGGEVEVEVADSGFHAVEWGLTRCPAGGTLTYRVPTDWVFRPKGPSCPVPDVDLYVFVTILDIIPSKK